MRRAQLVRGQLLGDFPDQLGFSAAAVRSADLAAAAATRPGLQALNDGLHDGVAAGGGGRGGLGEDTAEKSKALKIEIVLSIEFG